MKRLMLNAAALLVAGNIALAAPSKSAPGNDEESEFVYEPAIALAAKLGTLGPGLELSLGMMEWLNLRAGGNYFRLHDGGQVSDVEYDFAVRLASIPLLADFHPWKNEFRVSAGLVYNRNQLDLSATPSKDTTIGGVKFTPEQIGELSGSAQFKHFAPYFGLGYGNAVLDADKIWGFVFDIGIMWQGSPDIDLAANGTLANNPIFQLALAQEESEIQDDADQFRFYPVLAFGISYQF